MRSHSINARARVLILLFNDLSQVQGNHFFLERHLLKVFLTGSNTWATLLFIEGVVVDHRLVLGYHFNLLVLIELYIANFHLRIWILISLHVFVLL
jgi:hypothetical protein